MGASSWVHVEVAEIVRETDKAFLIRLEDEEEEFWIPKSQVSDPEDYKQGDTDCTLSIAEWLAQEKGLVS